jgi:hypothetical protein
METIPGYRAGAAFWGSSGTKYGEIYLRRNATLYELMHELRHAHDYLSLGPTEYGKLTELQKEERVYEWIQNQRWLTDTELASAFNYIQQARAK